MINLAEWLKAKHLLSVGTLYYILCFEYLIFCNVTSQMKLNWLYMFFYSNRLHLMIVQADKIMQNLFLRWGALNVRRGTTMAGQLWRLMGVELRNLSIPYLSQGPAQKFWQSFEIYLQLIVTKEYLQFYEFWELEFIQNPTERGNNYMYLVVLMEITCVAISLSYFSSLFVYDCNHLFHFIHFCKIWCLFSHSLRLDVLEEEIKNLASIFCLYCLHILFILSHVSSLDV